MKWKIRVLRHDTGQWDESVLDTFEQAADMMRRCQRFGDSQFELKRVWS